MNDLLDLVFENLIPIIIVVSVVIRILVGIKNSAAPRGRSAAEVLKTSADDDVDRDVWSRLKPDDDEEDADDEEDEDDGGRGKPYYAPAEYSRPLLAPGPLREAPAAAIARPVEPAVETPDAGRPDRGPPGAGPLDRLNNLPPLRRAVVLAEILGPPRSLS